MSTTQYIDGNDMSLRDYFAAKAMQALLTAPKDAGDLRVIEKSGVNDAGTMAQFFASSAYLFADAMLAEREKGKARP